VSIFILSIVTTFIAMAVGYDRGRKAERRRVNHGMEIALAHLSSKAIYLLNGWNRGDITEDELLAGIKEYAAAKKEKRAEQEQAFYERLGRHKEGGAS
jgi:hypothetical protein